MKPARLSRQQDELKRAFHDLRQLEGEARTRRLDEIFAVRPNIGKELAALLAFAERHSSAGLDVEWLITGHAYRAEGIPDLVGRTVSHFLIAERLGSGGMGVVYRAEDLRLGRTVALKFLSPHLQLDSDARQRLIQEARTASALEHPNLCTVFEVDEMPDGRTFIAMSYYEGETIEQKLSGGPIPFERAIGYARQVLSGLHVAHECGIVHRDIKPGNILVTTDGTVKILDFGLAKLAGGTLSNTGAVVGTAAYMSPEQIAGDSVDHRTDLWSLGAVLYEMLSGRRAFGGSYELAILYSILHSEPAPLPDGVPERIRAVVDKCLRKDRAERYDSAAAVCEDLDRKGVRSRATFSRRRPARLALLAVILMLVVPGMWVAMTHGDDMYRGIQTALDSRPALPAERHIVVLPLTVEGDESSNAAFAQGLSEMLLSMLSRLESIDNAFWVVPADEVANRNVSSIEQARDAFGVTLALMGGVRREGDRVLLTLSLVDASSRHEIESREIEADIADAGAFQNRIAETLASIFQVGSDSGLAALRGASTVVPSAYDYYITGTGYLRDYDHIENVETAIDLLQRAVDADPNFARAEASLGEALWRKYGHTKETALLVRALAHSDHALRTGEGQVPVYIAVAMVRTEIGRYEEAIESLMTALAIEPGNADAHMQLAQTYEKLASVESPEENLERAEAHFRRAVELKANYWASFSELGRFYYYRGRFEEAAEQFKHALILAPRNALTYSRLGGAYAQMERYDDAILALQESVRIEPRHTTYLNLGTFYFFIHQDYRRAADIYREAVKLNRLDYRTWAMLGESLFWQEGLTIAARNAFEEAIRLTESASTVNTRDAVLLSRLALYHAYLDLDVEAERMIGEALAMGIPVPEVLAHAAEVHVLIGRSDRASEYVRRATADGYPRLYVDRSPLLHGIETTETPLPTGPQGR